MTPEENRMDPDLERAVTEIREEAIDPAVVEAAAAHVWARLAEAAHAAPADHIRDCAGFQALFADYRSSRLSEARTLLLRDHLHACVACRRAFEGKVVEFVAPPAVRQRVPVSARWAVAATVLVAAGASLWIAVDRLGTGSARPMVESVNGNLYEITDAGIMPLAAGQDLPDGVEIRTARDSFAVLRLRDGSRVEMRERSDFSASQSGRDLSLRLGRGSVIVEAAKRRSGHLFVNTADCRVAVTGTVFGVNAGMKGSRISVIQGEVHVAQENQEKVLHPGDQEVTSASLEPGAVQDDFAWSRDRDRLVRNLPAAAPARVSRLLARAPASTIFFVSIPQAGGFLDQAQEMLRRKMAQNPQLRDTMAGPLPAMDTMLGKLRAVRGQLGDEIAILAFAGPDGKEKGPVFLAETAGEGLAGTLAGTLKAELGSSVTIASRPGLVAFSPEHGVLEAFAPALDAAPNAFAASPCFKRIAESQAGGISLVACANLDRQAPGGMRYVAVEQKLAGSQSESRATLGFDGPRTGIAGWLAAPAPMGSLDYVSPEASFVAAFAVNDPAAVMDDLMGLFHRAPASEQAPQELRQAAAALGGEFALALDGPMFPVPSWKLAIEVYDPARFQAALERSVETFDRQAAKSGGKPLRTSRETVNGRVYYTIAGGDPNPLTEVHYTYAGGYAIAGPSRAVVNSALQVKSAGNSVTRSAKFVSMTPRDRYMNFSALIYQNLGTTLAPLAGLLGAFGNLHGGGMPGGIPGGMPDLSNIQPSFVAAYGEPDRITIAATGTPLGIGPAALEGGSLSGLAANLPALGQLLGTGKPRPAFR